MKAGLKEFSLFSVGLLLVSTFFAGCAATTQGRDLVGLFAPYRKSVPKSPVIIIPGLLGTELQDTRTGAVVWGENGRVPPYMETVEDLALPIAREPLSENRDSLRPVTVLKTMKVAGLFEFRVYRDIIGALVGAGGYTHGWIKDPRPGENLFVFTYDWRRGNVESAQKLHEFILDIRAKLKKPNLKFTLVSHSMGGLIAEYYLAYGDKDVLNRGGPLIPTWEGAQAIDKLVLIGTPNRGSLRAFQALHEGMEVGPGIAPWRPEEVFTSPAVYELLPHPQAGSQGFFVSQEGEPVPLDLYDADTWVRHGFSVFAPSHLRKWKQTLKDDHPDIWQNLYDEEYSQRIRFLALALERARRFQEALQAAEAGPSSVPVIIFGGDSTDTLRRALLVKHSEETEVRFDSSNPSLRKLLFSPGDGEVTKESVLGNLKAKESVFLPEKHVLLTRNTEFQERLISELLLKSRPSHAQSRRIGPDDRDL